MFSTTDRKLNLSTTQFTNRYKLPHPRQIAYFIFMANYTISSCYVAIEYLEPPPHCEKLNICSYQTLFNDVCQTECSFHLTPHHLCLKHRLIIHPHSGVFQCCSHQLSTAKKINSLIKYSHMFSVLQCI